MLLQKAFIISGVVFLGWANPSDDNTIFSGENEEHTFCYTDPTCGPSSPLWDGSCQTGRQQSPIALPSYGPPGSAYQLHLDAYRAPAFRLANNGHTVQLALLNSNGDKQGKVGLSRQDFENFQPQNVDYTLEQVHFHWGSEDSVGSEHALEGGGRFSMEMHLVHYRTKYKDITNALNSNDPNALSVIGIFLNVTKGAGSNQQLAPIVQNLGQGEYPKDGIVVVNQALDFTPLLPPTVGDTYMFNYHGSLTTPQCLEKVNWLVYTRATPISGEDVGEFRKLKTGGGEDSKNLVDNWRPLQKRNGRSVNLSPITTAT